MIKVYQITTFNDSTYYITPKQFEWIKPAIEKKSSAGIMIGDSYIRLASIKQIDSKNMEEVDLPIYCKDKLLKENPKLLEKPDEEKLGIWIGTIIRVYNEDGVEIPSPQKTDKNPPKRFAMIKRNQYKNYIAGKDGGQEEVLSEGKIIEQTFYRTVQENGYNDFVLVLSIKNKDEIILDRRPKNWDFVRVPNVE